MNSRADAAAPRSERRISRGRTPRLTEYWRRMRAWHGVGHGAEPNCQVHDRRRACPAIQPSHWPAVQRRLSTSSQPLSAQASPQRRTTFTATTSGSPPNQISPDLRGFTPPSTAAGDASLATSWREDCRKVSQRNHRGVVAMITGKIRAWIEHCCTAVR